MATQLKTKTSELGDSRVRVEVEVEPAAVDRALSHAAANLGRDLKIPGFRKGKVPAQVVLQRVGREAVLDEAVRQALPDCDGEAGRGGCPGAAGLVRGGDRRRGRDDGRRAEPRPRRAARQGVAARVLDR